MRNRVTLPVAYLGLLIAGWVAFALHVAAGVGGKELDEAFNDVLYNVLMFGAALAVLARAAIVPRQRTAWLAMGTGVLLWSGGELYYSLFIEGTSAEAAGTVSVADGLFLAMYPCMYLGMGVMARERLRLVPVGIWLDGVIAGLAAATVAAALVLPAILDHATGNLASVVVSSAYPIGDLVLLLFAVGVLGVSGWRPGAVWLLISTSMLLSAVADSAYMYQTAVGTFNEGGWLTCLWPLAALSIAVAAWTPYKQPAPRPMRSWELISAPSAGLMSAMGVLVYGNVAHRLSPPVLSLALITLVAVGIHLALTTRQNLALVESTRRLSLTDPLTGLGNRRRLIADLAQACASAHPGAPWELVLYDLDGFKRYNDAFGHPAGDALLSKLSKRLQETVEPHGVAYRMGGDEFCVLFDCGEAACKELIARSVRALCDEGPDFRISASHGSVRIPTEAPDPSGIMQLADDRLYGSKERLSAHRISNDAYDGEHALAAGKRHGHLLSGAGPEQGAGHGGVGGYASLPGSGVAGADDVPLSLRARLVADDHR